MDREFLNKLLNRDFENLSIEELNAIVNSEDVFPMTKKDKKVLEKIISKNTLDSDRSAVVAVLGEAIPQAIVILNKLDKFSIDTGPIKIDLKNELLDDLNQMNNFQLCIFIDKVMFMSKEYKINFLRHKVYSLHEINSAFSRSFGLSLAFEIFKPGESKRFMVVDYSRLNKDMLINVIINQMVHCRYILKAISEAVLSTEESKLTGTKINKMIREAIAEYIDIIKEERKALRATGVRGEPTWTYTLCNLLEIEAEGDMDYFDEEDID